MPISFVYCQDKEEERCHEPLGVFLCFWATAKRGRISETLSSWSRECGIEHSFVKPEYVSIDGWSHPFCSHFISARKTAIVWSVPRRLETEGCSGLTRKLSTYSRRRAKVVTSPPMFLSPARFFFPRVAFLHALLSSRLPKMTKTHPHRTLRDDSRAVVVVWPITKKNCMLHIALYCPSINQG